MFSQSLIIIAHVLVILGLKAISLDMWEAQSGFRMHVPAGTVPDEAGLSYFRSI